MEETEISEEPNRRPAILNIYIGLFLLLAIGGVALEYERWVGHALIAIISLVLMIILLRLEPCSREGKREAQEMSSSL